MAWHLGYPLSQTLFTNVYIDAILTPEPVSLEDADFVRNRSPGSDRDPLLAILRAYCLGLLKACWYVNERLVQEHYYEVTPPRCDVSVTTAAARLTLISFDRRKTSSQIHTTEPCSTTSTGRQSWT